MGSLEAGQGARRDHSSAKPRAHSKSEDISASHRRSISGGFLAKLPFLRASSEDVTQVAPPSFPQRPPSSPAEQNGYALPNAMAAIMQQSKGRKRKGSLRKTAILGTGKLGLDRRSSNYESVKKIPPSRHSLDNPSRYVSSTGSPKRFSFELADGNSSSEGIPVIETSTSYIKPLTRIETDSSVSSHDFHHLKLESPVTSPTGTYASTTDDDDLPPILSSPTAPSTPSLTKQSSISSSDSYFGAAPPQTSRHRAQPKPTSPLSRPDPPLHGTDEAWDYTSTARWGWVVLISTWLVFVVGMGSCFSVWSWSWDVGETPYAPPELENDPTLPIVGYYPALLVLTAVVSWVWVVVAWVGMKYFRHAKMAGEEG